MEFEIGDRVKIKDTDIYGYIIDIYSEEDRIIISHGSFPDFRKFEYRKSHEIITTHKASSVGKRIKVTSEKWKNREGTIMSISYDYSDYTVRLDPDSIYTLLDRSQFSVIDSEFEVFDSSAVYIWIAG